ARPPESLDDCTRRTRICDGRRGGDPVHVCLQQLPGRRRTAREAAPVASRRTTEHVPPVSGRRRGATETDQVGWAAARAVRRSAVVPEGSVGPGRGSDHHHLALLRAGPRPPGRDRLDRANSLARATDRASTLVHVAPRGPGSDERTTVHAFPAARLGGGGSRL